MPLRGVRERSMWLALAVLRGIEKREGAIARRAAVEALTGLLGYSERQARLLLRLLVEEQYLLPVTRGLRVAGFRVTAKGLAQLERLHLA
jgi:hypothetical protein